MKREQENGLILTTMELHLCMELLGREEWEGFPVLETNQSLEQRMLEAFFHLADLGLVEHEPEGYVISDELPVRLYPVVWPQRILTACSRTGLLLNAYQEDGRIVIVQQVLTEEQSCRVYPAETEELAELLVDEMLPETEDANLDQPLLETLPEDITLEELLKQSEVVILVTSGDGTLERLLRLWRSKEQLMLSLIAEAEISTEAYTAQGLNRLLGENEV
ncbi:MAG: hypothetical protein LUG44_07825 [Clostridiales bacterium]|nr:hypothetical protein [Clostridiales bacterium]